jgi:hypothetical protein
VTGDAQAHLIGDAAEPGEFGTVEFGFVEERRDAHAARERADDGAVFGSDGINVIGRLEAPGTGHVLRHDAGTARNILTEMPRQKPRICIVAAAHAIADEERNALALVKILDTGRAGRLRRNGGGEHGRNAATDQTAQTFREPTP